MFAHLTLVNINSTSLKNSKLMSSNLYTRCDSHARSRRTSHHPNPPAGEFLYLVLGTRVLKFSTFLEGWCFPLQVPLRYQVQFVLLISFIINPINQPTNQPIPRLGPRKRNAKIDRQILSNYCYENTRVQQSRPKL